jgi:hypothetical protein
VGVADMLVPAYCRVCEALVLPCYATQRIVDVFAFKDEFKGCCERYGIHGIPGYALDENLRAEDIAKIRFPVMVKPVDSASGQGIVRCDSADELRRAVPYALSFSKEKRFIVERYMECDDMGCNYTFKDGKCSASCIYDRYTTGEQARPGPGLPLAGPIPPNTWRTTLPICTTTPCGCSGRSASKDGVLMLSGFYEDGQFYVYDTGFRLQGKRPIC